MKIIKAGDTIVFDSVSRMSGNEEDPCDLLGTGYANRCLDSWEVKNGD